MTYFFSPLACLRVGKVLVAALVLVACRRETPTLKDFDAESWKKDRMGCMDKRASLIGSLTAQKEILKGLGQNQIIEILGKPDFQELASRNQRFYIYYYKRGQACEGGKPNLKQDAVLRVRFSALDGVNEVTY